MTRRRTISSLSIAAIVWLMAAVPSLAQTQSNREAQTSVATKASEQAIDSNAELIAAKKARSAAPLVSEVERTPIRSSSESVGALRLSASSFKVHSNFNTTVSDRFVRPQLAFKASPSDRHARTHLRRDDDDFSNSGKKLVSFIPSRGQKLPE